MVEDILLLVLFGSGQRKRRLGEKDSSKRREAEGNFLGMDILRPYSSSFMILFFIFVLLPFYWTLPSDLCMYIWFRLLFIWFCV